LRPREHHSFSLEGQPQLEQSHLPESHIMAGTNAPASSSPLNPAAAEFTMPSESTRPATANVNGGANGAPQQQQQQQQEQQNPTVNGQAKMAKQKKPDAQVDRSATAETIAEAGTGAKLTGAQLKKQKAAEKAARRAEKVAEREAQAQQPTVGSSGSKPELQRRLSTGKKEGDASHHKRTGSASGKSLSVRAQATAAVVPQEKPQEGKKVNIFSHLYPKEKRATLAGAGREIHPAVLALGLQLRDYVICGGNARCAAMLLAFKKVIQAYTTPPGVALSRHLTTHLGHQISYLSHARPLSISQGNSIRWLKKLISALDPDLAENEAKQFLCQSIDQFIREKITLADEVIAREASSRIVDGDVILTYAKSSVVEKTLLTAHRQGTQFRVIVVDSRPLFEGKNHARSLIRAGLHVQYCLLNGIADVVADVTKCFLGASAMLGNGRLLSRAGTAMVAMMAKDVAAQVPVIVLSESVKFSAKVALDSVVMNELGEAEALVESEQPETLTSSAPPAPSLPTAATKTSKKGKDEDDSEERRPKGLEGWKEVPNLYLLNLMYDVTPAEYLDMVICELGSLPPVAVPVVNGVQGEDE